MPIKRRNQIRHPLLTFTLLHFYTSMCGIAGILSFKPTDNTANIKRLTDAIAHRGPDSDGFYNDDHISLGHRRLSIIDLSEAANQPFVDNTGNYIIIYNGEIYNYAAVKQMLPCYAFRTHSDSEAVLAAYIQWGPDCLQHLKGMFAFAIWNKAEKRLFIARDRLGVKPIYYYKDDEQLVFASEMRPIKKLLDNKLSIDTGAVKQYFRFQSFYGPRTLYREIKQVKAAHYIETGASGAFGMKSYWNVAQPGTTYDCSDAVQVKKEVFSRLQTAVERRMVSDVPVAAFLSGGIDSSVAVGLMSRNSATPVNTFNISFDEEAFNEAEYARMVAKKFGTTHHEIKLKSTVLLDELEHALDAMDIPSADGVNTYVVSGAVARNKIKVAVSGVGGDELFAGYPFFRYFTSIQKKKWVFSLPQWVRKAASPVLARRFGVDSERMQELLCVARPDIQHLHPQFRTVIPSRTVDLLVNDPYNDSDPDYLNDYDAFINRLPLLSQVSVAEYCGYTQHTLLKDADQMSMAHSLEVREPFFDSDLIEYVLQVPDQIKQSATPKGLMVEAVGDLLPPEIVHRKKQGFVFPWQHWLKNELKDFCEQHIRFAAETGWLNEKGIMNIWQRFLAGDTTVKWTAPWEIAVLGYWLKKNS